MPTQWCGCDPEAKYVSPRCTFHQAAPAVFRETPESNDTLSNPVILEMAKILDTSDKIQKFNSGATRSSEGHKFDYEGFVNPEAEHVFAEYMHTHRFQRDGSIRDSDNWQKGIPFANYMRSMVRHMFDAWRLHRGYAVTDPDTGNPATMSDLMCAIRFNAMGYLKEIHDPSLINGGKE